MGFVETTLEIEAPVEACFDQWMCAECLPRVIQVITGGEIQDKEYIWHWRVTDPAVGEVMAWDTVLDTIEENKVISWHSRDGAKADTSGVVQFKPLDKERTQVHIEMMLNPPVQSSEFIHDYFGRRIEQIILDDLARYKNTLENEPVYHLPAPVGGIGEVHERYRNLTPLSIRVHGGRTHEFRDEPAV